MLNPSDCVVGLKIICINDKKQKFDPYVMEGEFYTIKEIFPPEDHAPVWTITLEELAEFRLNDDMLWSYRIDRFAVPVNSKHKQLETSKLVDA